MIAIVVIVGLFLSYWLGKYHGRTEERNRVNSLLMQSIQRKLSGSVRWVMNAVDSGEDQLMNPDQFFGS